MGTEFERKIIEKLDKIERVVNGLDTLNRNIESLIKILLEKEKKRD